MRACFQHRVCYNEEEGLVRDRVITCATLGFLLGVLKCVYVLEDASAVLVVLLHFVLDREDVDGVKSAADRLEVVQQLPWGDLCKQGLLVL